MQGVALGDRRPRAVAADDGDDALVEQLLSRLHAGLGITSVVFRNGHQLPAVDAAGRVDVVDGELPRVPDGTSRVRIRSREGPGDPDVDRATRAVGA